MHAIPNHAFIKKLPKEEFLTSYMQISIAKVEDKGSYTSY